MITSIQFPMLDNILESIDQLLRKNTADSLRAAQKIVHKLSHNPSSHYCQNKNIERLHQAAAHIYQAENANGNITVAQLIKGLSLLEPVEELEHFMISVLIKQDIEVLPEINVQRYLHQPLPEPLPILSDEAEALIKKLRFYGYPFSLQKKIKPPEREKIHTFCTSLQEICEPYTQQEYAKLLSEKLALSLIQPKHPPLLVLHGTPYSGIDSCAEDIQKLLVRQDYKPLVIEGKRFCSDSDSHFIFFGSPSVWSGSRPGLLTEFVYKNPKAVIVIHDIDKMNPAVLTNFADIFKNDNIVADEYGLENCGKDRRETAAQPTPVNFSQTVFIFTTTCGSHIYEQTKILNSDTDVLINRAYAALEHVHFQRKQETVPVFSKTLLTLMRAGLVAMPPAPFSERVTAESRLLLAALEDEARHFQEDRIVITEDDLRLLSATLLLNENYSSQHLHFNAADIIRPLLFSQESVYSGPLQIEVLPEAAEAIKSYLNETQPQAFLRKRGKTITPIFTPEGRIQRLSGIREEKIFRNADHEGSICLLADYPTTRFADIIGHHRAKTQLQEMIAVLKNATEGEDYQRGVLLSGMPGVGKTMLAQAFAGEAQMAFIAVTGTELLYADAITRLKALLESHSPCVIFIDEADSLPARDHNSNYAPQVNSLLALIQGINSDSENQAFWILASNYAQRLDRALLRAGRIEQTLRLYPPQNAQERLPFFKDLTLSEEQCRLLADITEHFTGAMLSRLRRKLRVLLLENTSPEEKILYQAVLDVLHGEEEDKPPVEEAMKKRVAIHEAGHAVAQLCLGDADAHLLLTLRNGESSAGFLQTLNDDSSLNTPESLHRRLCVLLAGRAAEQQHFGDISSGCSHDLEVAGKLAYFAAADACFSPDITGLYVSPLEPKGQSEALRARYEESAAAMVAQAWDNVLNLLKVQNTLLIKIADALIADTLLDNKTLRSLYHQYGV